MTVPEEPPVMPTADEAEVRTDPPIAVRVSFWMWVLAGALGIVGAVLFFRLRDDWALREYERFRAAGKSEVSAADLAATANGLSWWLLLGSAMFFGFFLLLAYQARRGVRKARTLLLVVAVFAALFQYSVGRVTIYGLGSSLVIIVAVGLLFGKGGRRFFRAAP
ncbi:hypothetical protein [Actinokineospora globicatena]|uniref:hypothetical protein n=1 Tax=Actinokineospora globicatena TaxID=103729 RepID=UPI0020A3FF9B|nr:hypothetical protein [Actinokineospora globicatena]GLW76655.1 hypothetical protein Aglo01_11370 [Actinokineospora globicatena]GLW83489.1 hypothetical protein Aglo02_11290 [Actinokineospora globicatena]